MTRESGGREISAGSAGGAGVEPVLLAGAVEQRQDLGAGGGDGDGVLEVSGTKTVPGHHGPAVVEDLGLGTALDDGWTVVTRDGSRSAHFEHTVAITPAGPEVLTLLDGARQEDWLDARALG